MPTTEPMLDESQPDDGVDVTLIRWMLEMTPAERLQTLQETMRSLEELRAGMPRD